MIKQIKELHEAAGKFEGYNNGEISAMLREAADAIESLRDRLQEEDDALRDYRASQIAAEAERRLQEGYGQVPEKGEREGEHESYSQWHALFGTPERAARTLQPNSMRCEYCLLRDYCKDGICLIADYDALLDWLRGTNESRN